MMPYLSIVITGRNDDYGQDFLGRLRLFVRHLDWQVQRYADLIELIVVEWNPLADRDALVEILPTTRWLTVRVITVPADVHATLNSPMPVLEFLGKNTGIRRARGQFVLATNPDVLFTQDMIDWLATRQLRSDYVYRTDRYDFRGDGNSQWLDHEILERARAQIFIMHSMDGPASVSVPVSSPTSLAGLPRGRARSDIMHTNAAGDFILTSREAMFTIRGLYEDVKRRWHVDSISLYRFHWAGIKQQVLQSPCCILHQDHPRAAQDQAYVHQEILDLSRAPGSTDWGLQARDLPEIHKQPI